MAPAWEPRGGWVGTGLPWASLCYLWFFWANDQTMSVAAALGPQDAQEDTLLIKGAGQASWAGASLG